MLAGDIFDPFAKVHKHLEVKKQPVCVDNWVYGLHRKWSFILAFISVTIMVAYTCLVEQNSLIACVGPKKEEIPNDFLTDWCYLTGTYIIDDYIGKKVGIEVPHPGIGPERPSMKMKRSHHAFYMFYPILLLLQYAFFQASKSIWGLFEGGRLKALLHELVMSVETTEEKKKRLEDVAEYMIYSQSPFHSSYAYQFILCEFYNALNVVFQFFIINFAFNGQFLDFGWNAMDYLQAEDVTTAPVNPFVKMFPKVTKCLFPRIGSSGNMVVHEALCVLPWNNVAEKFFLFWWFWLTMLGFITVLGLMYRFIVLFSFKARYILLHIRTRQSGCDTAKLRSYCEGQNYGDWFVLSLIQKNLRSGMFAMLVDELDKQRKGSGKRKIN